MEIERARPEDLAAVVDLLERHGLPREGIAEHLATMVVAREGGQVVGTAALELYEDGALLRSVAVAPSVQGQGLGHRLTGAALQLASDAGVAEVFLLTTTAERFFPKLGFEAIAREQVPAGVQGSVEFTTACPASAVVMRRRLSRKTPSFHP